MRLIPVLLVALAATFGCHGRSAPAPVRNAAPVQDDRPAVENLDYVNWKAFKVGTLVKRRSATRIGPNETVSVETFKLLEVSDKEVVIERQNTTERSDGSLKQVNPPERRTFARSFTLPRGMKVEDFQKPSLSAKETGEETVTVCGKPLKAKVFQWTDRAEAGPMAVTVWISDEVPGRIVKQEMKVASIQSHTLDEVIEITLP